MKKIYLLCFSLLIIFSSISFAGEILVIKIIDNSLYQKSSLVFNLNKEVGKNDTTNSYTISSLDEKSTPVLVKKIFTVPGIVKISLSERYQIFIQIGEAFNLDEVKENIITTLKKHYHADEVMLKK
ncbi:hypothetical protein C0583_06935 [Candidatus Parcubacteria bacterium]|nr:MAG: hypothetical protein C0583_06935 [Candidatus Parcubacteria bacterium]